MNIIVIGGVAAGTKTAAKLMRENHNAKVTIYTKGKDISYAGCGLPYYVGGAIETKEELIVNTPKKFSDLTGVDVKTEMEAISLDSKSKTVTFKNGEVVSYDKLVIATGATPFIPNIEGTNLKGVFTMRTPDDAINLRDYVEENKCSSVVVAGAGFIGLEIAENLLNKGLNVTVVDMANQVMPNLFDEEIADYIRKQLNKKGIQVILNASITGVLGEEKATGISTTVGSFNADAVVLAIGVRPATTWLNDSGIKMNKGTIVVDNYQKTNLEDVYAVGDCAQVFNRLTNKSQWSAMGSTANITGRCLANNLSGNKAPYKGCLGTGVVKLTDDLNAGRTGLTEEQAKNEGYDVITVTCVTDDKAHYYPDASSFITKLIADKESHKLLGIQVLGSGAVDKMVDIAVVGISMDAKVEDFNTLDFAYAPPFSTAIHPFTQACYILENKMNNSYESITPKEYASNKAKDYKIIDVSPVPSIPGAKFVSLEKLDGPIEDIDLDEKILLVCAKGKRGYLVQNLLKSYGYTNTKALEGGLTLNNVKVSFEGKKIPPEEIRRVKAFGCLEDKRYPDVFNVRVITRNGKITSREHHVVAEAAERFGSSEVTMTTRLTLEIQGVKHSNIDPLVEFLNENGLETGGTGSVVRPVVSCKGTTCKFGLADTFSLSEKIHEAFYVGYRDVILPHKFKICVGGCPNNCAKPSLNDLGVMGQKMPIIDYGKCRGCKKCQIIETCPMKAASLVDGKIHIDKDLCNNCGLCIGKCPLKVFEEYRSGFKVFIGGRWGKKVAHGIPLTKFFNSEEEVIDIIEKAILLFRDEGITRERFSDTIERLGFDYVNEKLISGNIDKASILKKTVKGGATC